MITTVFITVGALLLAMIGSVVLDPRSEAAEESARMTESVF